MGTFEEGDTRAQVKLALQAVLRIDSEITMDPQRFRRAIADVLPDDERIGNLLGTSVELGTPELVRDEHFAQAVAQLMDHGGIDRHLARLVVQYWIDGLSAKSSPFDFSVPTGGEVGPEEANGDEAESFGNDFSESPTGAYQVRIASFSKDELLVAVSTSDGFFATSVSLTNKLSPRWRRMASPDSPLSRDLFVQSDQGGHVMALWSDKVGVETISIRRSSNDTDASVPQLAFGRPRLLVAGNQASQIRYPIAAISTDKGLLDVFWTSDRQKLFRSSIKPGISSETFASIPDACHGSERLSTLDALLLSEQHCILAALTDRFRILVSDWDLDVDLHGSWRSIAVPVDDMMAISLVRAEERSLLFGCTKQGRMFAVDIGESATESWPWWQVNLPDSIGGFETQSISVASYEEQLWLAMSGRHGLSLVSANLRGRRLEIDNLEWILK